MLHILAITAPIYLIIGTGFLAVRFRLFGRRGLRTLGRFVADLCVPALLLRTLATEPIGSILNPGYLAAYAAGSLAVLLGTIFVVRRLRGASLQQAALEGLGMSSSNSAFIGYPIVSQVVGPVAALALALCMLVENLLVIPLAIAVAEHGRNQERPVGAGIGPSLRALARNPMIVAIVAGVAISLAGVSLPDVLSRTLQMVASAASPTALFVIGGTLVGLQTAGMRRQVASITFGKLVLHPLAVLAALLVLPRIDPLLRSAAVTYAAVPMLSIYPVVAQKHRLEALCAAALLATTAVSFVTISIWLWIVRELPGFSS
jgi:malonate transporter